MTYSLLKHSAVHSRKEMNLYGVFFEHLQSSSSVPSNRDVQNVSICVAVHGADTSLLNLSWKFCSKCQDKEWQQRREGAGTKKTMEIEAVGKACFLRKISRELEERLLFAILFKCKSPLSFKLRNQRATNTFLDKAFALQSLATGAIRK